MSSEQKPRRPWPLPTSKRAATRELIDAAVQWRHALRNGVSISGPPGVDIAGVMNALIDSVDAWEYMQND